MAKHWNIHSPDLGIVQMFRSQLGISDFLAILLEARGLESPDAARIYLEPTIGRLRPPEELPGCEETARKLARSVLEKRQITIYGDYDADGITATSILYMFLKSVEADVDYYIPERKEGYGLHNNVLKMLYERGTRTVVTVDCGITNLEEAETARLLGIELLVTDHHQPGAKLPKVSSIAHPQLAHVRGIEIDTDSPFYQTVKLVDKTTPESEKYPFPWLCGAGVAQKLAWALCRAITGKVKAPPELRNVLVQSVGLAAIGTIADMVPMLDENRIIVKYGLQNPLKDYPPLGLLELMNIAKMRVDKQLRGDDIAFQIAPRLNAAGRTASATVGVELLTTNNRARARDIAGEINRMNLERQQREREIFEKAVEMVYEKGFENDPALVLAGKWHSGVIGIVANRLTQMFNRPVVMISLHEKGDDVFGSGSARGVPNFDLYKALEHCNSRGCLSRFGGHFGAAGLGIEGRENLDNFKKIFCDYVEENWPEEEREIELDIDAEFPLLAFTYSTVREIERLEPFGQQNPRPIFCSKGVMLSEGSAKTMGTDNQHFTCFFEQENQKLRATAFNSPGWVDILQEMEDVPLDIAFQVKLNHFAGKTNVELDLIDCKRSV